MVDEIGSRMSHALLRLWFCLNKWVLKCWVFVGSNMVFWCILIHQLTAAGLWGSLVVFFFSGRSLVCRRWNHAEPMLAMLKDSFVWLDIYAFLLGQVSHGIRSCCVSVWPTRLLDVPVSFECRESWASWLLDLSEPGQCGKRLVASGSNFQFEHGPWSKLLVPIATIDKYSTIMFHPEKQTTTAFAMGVRCFGCSFLQVPRVAAAHYGKHVQSANLYTN